MRLRGRRLPIELVLELIVIGEPRTVCVDVTCRSSIGAVAAELVVVRGFICIEHADCAANACSDQHEPTESECCTTCSQVRA